MKTRPLTILTLIVLLGTILWLVLMVASGVPETFEAALEKVTRQGLLYNLVYLNAAFLVTLPVTLWMALLYANCRHRLPEWAAWIGLICVPVYGTLNLLVYLSQITLVPQLVEMHQQAETRAAAEALLRVAIQDLPGSTVGFFNGLAYGILGIPSIIFGIELARRGSTSLRVGGVLLVLNGVACITAVAGSLLGLAPLEFGSVLGGGLFLLALFPLTWAFFTGR